MTGLVDKNCMFCISKINDLYKQKIRVAYRASALQYFEMKTHT
jgi:hypothetical protein